MFRTEKKNGASALLLACVLLSSVTACGGGGGGSSASPPPPVAPANTPPVAVVSVNQPSVDERQPIIIDATQSSDNDGDRLTYGIRQTAGPTSTLNSSDDGVFTYDTPAVDSDVDVTFAVTVNDGTATSEANVTVAVENYDRTPLTDQWGPAAASLQFDSPVIGVFGRARSVSVSVDYGNNTSAQYDVDLSGGLGAVAVPKDPHLILDDLPEGDVRLRADFNWDTRRDIAVLSRSDSQIETFLNVDDGNGRPVLEPSGGAVVPGACAMVPAFVGDARPTGSEPEYWGILVGTEGNGLTALLNDGNPRSEKDSPNAGNFTRSETLTTSGTACWFQFSEWLDGNREIGIIAYDSVRHEITGLPQPATSPLTESQPIRVDLPHSDMRMIQLQTGTGNHGQLFWALLYSDGEHAGNHAVVILQDVNGIIEQTTIPLPNGVPPSMLVHPITNQDPDDPPPPGHNDTDSDVIIWAPETPYIYVLENKSGYVTEPVEPVRFADPQFFEVGFGVTTVTLAPTLDVTPDLVTGNSNNEVTFYPNRHAD